MNYYRVMTPVESDMFNLYFFRCKPFGRYDENKIFPDVSFR